MDASEPISDERLHQIEDAFRHNPGGFSEEILTLIAEVKRHRAAVELALKSRCPRDNAQDERFFDHLQRYYASPFSVRPPWHVGDVPFPLPQIGDFPPFSVEVTCKL